MRSHSYVYVADAGIKTEWSLRGIGMEKAKTFTIIRIYCSITIYIKLKLQLNFINKFEYLEIKSIQQLNIWM